MSIDTLAYSKTLESAGLDRKAAEALTQHILPDLVTKADLDQAVRSLESRIDKLENQVDLAIERAEHRITLRLMRRTISGYARHPNFAGVLVLGLGCETNQISGLLQAEGLEESATLTTMTIQDTGGTTKTVREGVARLKAMLPAANDVRRQTVPASHLTLALQCGGSDGYSGITANPALGACVDLLVRHGGTAVLSETPEIYGAEHLLTRRAASRAVGEKLVERIRWWEDYTARTGGEMNNNPSPGNKAGGLTTILEKSLGAVAKGGSTNLVDVYRYAEPITKKGFVFMDTPGYDPVSATGQVAGGANIICFTTGRGSVFGCKPAPSLKLATNTPLFRRMEDDMDIDCGPIADGEASVAEMGERIFKLVLDTASGKQTKSEILGFGEDEFTPWGAWGGDVAALDRAYLPRDPADGGAVAGSTLTTRRRPIAPKAASSWGSCDE
jgi:altronate hydrolase